MSRTTEVEGKTSVAGGAEGDWTLVIVGPGVMSTHAATEGATLVIGRDAECEVSIDHPRISRRHTRVTIGRPCLVEDLGSRNGTRVGGQAVTRGAPVELERDQSFTLGPFTGVVIADRRVASAAPSALRVDDPDPKVPPPLLLTVAASPLTVLIRAETGAGKEVLAETLHRLSGRAGRLMRVNCASFSPELLESELFGHERGAFTGASAQRKGLLETAAGGSLFLDEIGEMPLALQARLLRAIEAREIVRVGGSEPVPVDVRFIAATNRELPAEIARGAFRLDLYYRLAVVTLTIPPLRERLDRLPALAAELVRSAAARSGAAVPALSPAVVARLQAHDWPGNVRELRNVVERALLLAGRGELQPAHVIFDPPAIAAPSAAAAAPAPAGGDERQRIVDALQACAGNQTRAAAMLGMARSTLVTKLAIYGIARPQK